MEEYYYETQISNSKTLCIGAITHKEAETVNDDAPFCDGVGFYLYEIDVSLEPKTRIKVLAKLATEEAAHNLSKLLSIRT